MPELNLPNRTAKSLYRQLEKELITHNTRFWRKGTRIQLGKNWLVRLDHDVICRGRASGKPEHRFEFVDKSRSLGRDCRSDVHKIAGTLTDEKMKPRGYMGKKGLPKQKLAKYQRHTVSSPVKMAENEYAGAKKENLLRIQPPTIIGQDSYLIMKELPGQELDDILNDDYITPGKQLTHEQRFKLSIALLESLYNQVTRHGLIHRDIKPSNILVELDDEIKAYIIDFGFNVEANNLDQRSLGSLGYAATECMQNQWSLQSAKTDVFSMACVLAEIWRIDAKVMERLQVSQRLGKPGDLRQSLHCLFTGIHGLDETIKAGIKDILYRMLNPNPEERITLDEAIREFKALSLNNTAAIAGPSSSLSARSSLPPPSQVNISQRERLNPPSGCLAQHGFFKGELSCHSNSSPATPTIGAC